jgi:hypothetical protein
VLSPGRRAEYAKNAYASAQRAKIDISQQSGFLISVVGLAE